VDADGRLDVLLITSRGTKRWVIPKGNLMPGMARARAAEQEAYEEAGVVGTICPSPLNSYRYDKYRRDGSLRRATVSVYPLAVTGEFDDFPERGQRLQRWFPLVHAAEAVGEPGLRVIIASFHPRPGHLRALRIAVARTWMRLAEALCVRRRPVLLDTIRATK
jgi:8-oxo-dGTP pyrophosphatase MutT (NUDIX family)